jgi:hypothetical protein
VPKLKLKSKREYLPLAEVANENEYGCATEELFSEAAIGELTIYVRLDQTQAGIVCSEKPQKPMPQTDGEIFIDTMLNPPTMENVRRKNKVSKEYNRYSLFGMQPIASSVFEMKKSDRALTNIELDVGKILTGKNGKIFFQILLIKDPSVTLQDALDDDDKLFVMKSDLQKMLSEESSAAAVAKPKGIAGKKTVKGPRHGTLERYADWQRRAEEKKSKDPKQKKPFISDSISRDLLKEKSEYYAKANTIRQHIKI